MTLTPEEYFCRVAENAMARLQLNRGELAEAIGCGRQAVHALLECRPVRLDQRQVMRLLAAGGMSLQEKK